MSEGKFLSNKDFPVEWGYVEPEESSQAGEI